MAEAGNRCKRRTHRDSGGKLYGKQAQMHRRRSMRHGHGWRATMASSIRVPRASPDFQPGFDVMSQLGAGRWAGMWPGRAEDLRTRKGRVREESKKQQTLYAYRIRMYELWCADCLVRKSMENLYGGVDQAGSIKGTAKRRREATHRIRMFQPDTVEFA